MTRTTLLKKLNERCPNKIEYGNIVSTGLTFFKKLYEKNIDIKMPDCSTNMFLVSLINEKVKRLSNFKKYSPDTERKREAAKAINELLDLKHKITGWRRV